MPTDLRLPRYQQLRDDLATQIAQQCWRPGDAIPTGAGLAKTCSVTIDTIRETIDALATEGLLERSQGRGTSARHTNSTSSLFRFFRFQSESGGQRIPGSRIFKLSVLGAPLTPTADLQTEADAPIIHPTRLRPLDDAPIPAGETQLPYDHFASLTTLELDTFGDLLCLLYKSRCGQIIVGAEGTPTAETINATYMRLLRIQPGNPMIVIEHIMRGCNRVPPEWRRSRGAAVHFRYHVGIRQRRLRCNPIRQKHTQETISCKPTHRRPHHCWTREASRCSTRRASI